MTQYPTICARCGYVLKGELSEALHACLSHPLQQETALEQLGATEMSLLKEIIKTLARLEGKINDLQRTS